MRPSLKARRVAMTAGGLYNPSTVTSTDLVTVRVCFELSSVTVGMHGRARCAWDACFQQGKGATKFRRIQSDSVRFRVQPPFRRCIDPCPHNTYAKPPVSTHAIERWNAPPFDRMRSNVARCAWDARLSFQQGQGYIKPRSRRFCEFTCAARHRSGPAGRRSMPAQHLVRQAACQYAYDRAY